LTDSGAIIATPTFTIVTSGASGAKTLSALGVG